MPRGRFPPFAADFLDRVDVRPRDEVVEDADRVYGRRYMLFVITPCSLCAMVWAIGGKRRALGTPRTEAPARG